MKTDWAADESDDEEYTSAPPPAMREEASQPQRQVDGRSRDREDRGGHGRGGYGRGDGGGRGGYNRDVGRGDGGGGRGGPARDPVPVPDRPPFIVYVGGLNFQTTSATLREYFDAGGCKSIEAAAVATDETGRSKGFGHVQFRDRADILLALTAHETECEGRRIKVYVESKKTHVGGGGGYRERSGSRDGGRMGGGDRGRGGGRGGYDGGRGGYDGGRGGGGGGGGDRYRQAGGGEEGGDWSRGARREGGGAGRGGGGRGGGGGGGGRGGERPKDNQPGAEGAAAEQGSEGADGSSAPAGPKVRPVLQLAPRTKPVDEVGAPIAAAASIFGEAKPRDEAAIEEARRKKKAEDRKAAAAAAPASAEGGDAAATPASPEHKADKADKGKKPPKHDKPDKERPQKTAGPGAGGAGRGGEGKGQGKGPASAPKAPSSKDEKKAAKKVSTRTRHFLFSSLLFLYPSHRQEAPRKLVMYKIFATLDCSNDEFNLPRSLRLLRAPPSLYLFPLSVLPLHSCPRALTHLTLPPFLTSLSSCPPHHDAGAHGRGGLQPGAAEAQGD